MKRALHVVVTLVACAFLVWAIGRAYDATAPQRPTVEGRP